LASFAEAEVRDALRYENWYNLFNKNPLGSVAGYGTTLPIDRELTSRLLAFDAPERNSLDPITNRWEAECEFASILSIVTNHLSTIAQTLILLSTKEFSILQLDDRYKTGSSIMPQKKNPCVMEIVRAKAALAHGYLMSLLSIGKASFIGYNRDTQWTKYLIMDLIREVHPAIEMVREVVSSLKVNHEQMYNLSKKSFVTATTLLESLVLEFNLPFRVAKFLLEKAVRYSEEQGEEVISFQSLKRAMEEEGIKSLELLTENFVKKHQEPYEAIMRVQSSGGPQKEMLSENLRSLMDEVAECESWLKEKSEKVKAALEEIKKVESQLNL
jgi:argininosuccinate lyase